MANNKKYNSSLVLSEDYLLVWDLKFTLLEKYIFKIIERSTDGGCSDEEISAALTLRCDEIQYVIRDELLRRFIQGDHSRRTIADDFTGMEYAIVKNDAESGRNLLTKAFEQELNSSAKYTEIKNGYAPDSLKKCNAKKYYLVHDNQD